MTKKKIQSTPRATLNLARPLPRLKVKGRIGDMTVVKGNEYLSTITSDASGVLSGSCPLFGGQPSGLTASAINGVAALYSTFKYLPGTMLHWVPQVSMSTAGIVYMAYTDNPEVYTDWFNAANNNAKLAVVRRIANVKSSPIWQPFSLPMPTTLRRKRFDVNPTCPENSTDALDRSWQGAWLYAVEGTTPSTVVARPYRFAVLDLEGLRNESL